MSNNVTLIAKTSPRAIDFELESRSPNRDDIPALGDLFFSAYDSGIAEKSVDAARQEIEAAFDGQYGPLLLDASQVALDESGQIIAGILVVERPSEPGTPEAPFLVELFTDRDHRRQGLAEKLVQLASEQLHQQGFSDVAVRVNSENSAALALYLSIDFRRWDEEDGDL